MGQKQGVRDVGLAFFLSLVYRTEQFATTLILSYKRRGRRGPLPQHWRVLNQYGLGWKFKAGNVVK